METPIEKQNTAESRGAGSEVEHRNAIQTLVSEFLQSLGVSTDSVEVSEGPRIVVKISSPENKILIGTNGDSLRALNHIVRKLAEKKIDADVNFVVDVGGHLEAELERIRSNARMLAQRARLFKHEVELDPMSSYERLVIHELFSDDPEIQTESRGEGKFRRIILKYVDKPSSTPEI